MENIKTCSSCGVLFDREIAQSSIYKEVENGSVVARLYFTTCPVCKKTEIDKSAENNDYYFSDEEVTDYIKSKEKNLKAL